MNYLIKGIRYGITEGGMACGPVSGNVVASIEFQDDDKVSFLSMVEVFGIPEFYFSEEDIYNELLEESEDFIDKANSLIINEFNGIELKEYEDIMEELKKPYNEEDKALIKLLIAVVRLDYDEADKLIEESVGKYIKDINIPDIDLDD
jgi:hypothetical protein